MRPTNRQNSRDRALLKKRGGNTGHTKRYPNVLWCDLNWAYLRLHFTLSRFLIFFFFMLEVGFMWGTDLPVGLVFCAQDPLALWTSTHWSEMALFVGPVHCSRDPQTSFFTHTLFKNRFYSTVHIFKNYFVTVFSVFSKISCIQTDL